MNLHLKTLLKAAIIVFILLTTFDIIRSYKVIMANTMLNICLFTQLQYYYDPIFNIWPNQNGMD